MRNKIAAVFIVFVAPHAQAETWVMDKAKSQLAFEGTQAKEAFHGAFSRFEAEIVFDEATPEKAQIHVTVDVASVTADSADRSEALPTRDWLDAKTFPAAEFTASRVTRTGQHYYTATGPLMLHGVSLPVTLNFTLTRTGNTMHAEGATQIDRKAFGIGSGQWESDRWVAYPVTVRFNLIATAK